MNRRSNLALLALVGALGAASLLEAPDVCAQADVRMIRPDVMVLMDTSGSMEWRNGVSNASCVGGDGGPCNQCSNGMSMCSTSCPAVEQRNRWTTALEVLTGTIQGFSCVETVRNNASTFNYDFLYPVPYHQPLSNGVALNQAGSVQAIDGILDTYSDRVRFGLMTFDNDYCVNQDVSGQYSYGLDRQFQPSGCAQPPVSVNVGSRRSSNGASDPIPGGLISVGPPNADPATLATINQAVQQAIVGTPVMGTTPAVPGVRPYGGTPIAGMLDDVRYYWNTNQDVINGSNGGPGDPYYNCRQRFNVLITDGRPNMDFRPACEGSTIGCPYPLPEQNALSMAMPGAGQTAVKTFVIGFNATDPGVTAALTPIAMNGGTGSVLYATDRTTLRAALSTVLDSISATTTTRTAPAFGGNSSGGSASSLYQFQSSFAVSSGVPWEGILERRRTECDSTMMPPAPVDRAVDPTNDEFGVLLQYSQRLSHGWGARRLWTSVPSGTATMNGTMSVVGGTASTRTAIESVPTSMFNLQTYAVPGTPACQTDANALLAWLRGDPSDSYRATRPLGAIYHSNPVVVGPPDAALPDQSYANFRRTNLLPSAWRTTARTITQREQTVYVGTTDGILHAFDADSGEEVWGFVPPYLVNSLVGMCPNTFRYGVDGTPVVRDVLFQRTSTSLDPGAPTSTTGWHTVLLVGLRGGGGAYAALDVTDPRNPSFMWQFTDTNLGYAMGTPVITNISTTWSTGTSHERAVAIIPGGSGVPQTICTPTSSPRPGRDPLLSWTAGAPRAYGRCWQGQQGQYLYVVDLASGQLIQRMGPTASPLVGSPSAYLGINGTVATRAYVGDADGVLWRLDMSKPNPTQWTFSMLYDTFYDSDALSGQPIQNAPLISVNRDGSLLIAVGTGDQDLLEGREANRIVTVTEQTNVGSTGAISGYSVNHLWRALGTTVASSSIPANGNTMTLEPGERLTGPISLYNGTMFFGTFVPNSSPDACQLGFSRLWGIDQTSMAADTLPTARLDVDGDPLTTSDIYRWTRDLNGNGTVVDDQNSVLYGVGVVRRPTCVTRTTSVDPYTGMNRDWVSAGANQGGDFRLVAQTGRGGVSTPGVRTNTFSRRLATPAVETQVNAWALVVE